MSVERIIGVDFGTSTSVIRVKRYQDGNPVGDRLETKQVTFNMGSSMVPTLVQKLNTGESVFFGYDAEISRRDTVTYKNFKIDIENADKDIRRQARELTSDFIGYLAKTYRIQSEGGHLGESTDYERTIISYPVKWSDETKAFMIETAKTAGFPNVEGLDEAQAAIRAVTIQNADRLSGKGYFKIGDAVNILLVDMGAGTTDLVLCRHMPGNNPRTEILSTWPVGGSAHFGGSEVDILLKQYICDSLSKRGSEMVNKRIGTDKFKTWKETVVSPALSKNEVADYFSALHTLLEDLGSDEKYSINRAGFEEYAADYLRQLPELVKDCVKAAGIEGKDVNLVVLTGGHSQWYFVKEILSGKLNRFGDTKLDKIRKDPDRIISVALPQESVALGLVFGRLNTNIPIEPLVHKESKSATCTENGNTEFWYRESDQTLFSDKNGSSKIEWSDVHIPALGHSFEWFTENNQRIQKCTRCGAIGQAEQTEQINSKVTADTDFAVNEYTPEEEFELSSIGENYVIRNYIGRREIIAIPPVIRDRKVVAIGQKAFSGKALFSPSRKIKKVIIPKTVKEIGENAFWSCTNLSEVVAHQDIEVIEKGAFLDCYKLQTVDFGMGVPGPKNVKFPQGLKKIGANAFSKTRGGGGCLLNEVTLSRQTKVRNSIGGKTFSPKQCAIFYYDA